MIKTSSYADLVRDWELLLAASHDNAANLADVERHRAALEVHLASVKELKGRQDSAGAVRQELTQELNKMLTDGRELAMRLRGGVKANLGPKNERLAQFKIAPLRKRSRSAKSPGGEPAGPAGSAGPVTPKEVNTLTLS